MGGDEKKTRASLDFVDPITKKFMTYISHLVAMEDLLNDVKVGSTLTYHLKQFLIVMPKFLIVCLNQ